MSAAAHCGADATSTSGAQHHHQPAPPDVYVIIYNVSKAHNIGTLIRSCTAFGVTAACLVGSRQFSAFGSHGSCEHMRLLHFSTLEACCAHLKETAGCRVLGVEIHPEAVAVQAHPFTGNTAFMLGNEGSGLSEKQMRLCDGFVYIPQHGGGTASLNVTVAASIILHQFAVWAGFPERQREGAKFVVAPRPQRTAPRGVVPVTPEEQAAEQLQRQRLGLDSDPAGDAGDGGAWLEAAMAEGGGLEGLLDMAGAGLVADDAAAQR